MIEFVQGGGVFSAEAIRDFAEMRPGPVPRDIQLIAIAVIHTHDGEFWYVRNGHHRAVSILLGGREILLPEEYEVENRTWGQFQDIHFLNTDGSWMGWVTPLDIRSECRLFNFGKYKYQVRDIYEDQGPEAAVEFIQANKKLYCEPRRLDFVPQLAEEIASEVGVTNAI